MAARHSRRNLKKFGLFEIVERLGFGGMGSVYKARHPNYAEPVALKVAHDAVAAEVTLSQRFQNEYLIGKDLSHPNLVKVLEFGIEEDLPYLVMEYIPGCNLYEHIERCGALTIDEATQLFAKIADVLHFVHQKNLVHRDIKPANFLVSQSGDVKLTDLGLVKVNESGSRLTHSHAALGTPDYGAPEQFEDAARVDRRCDIYALAVTLYFTLTGVFPFGRAGQAQIIRRKLMFEFAPLSMVLSKVGHGLDQTIIRALHPDPNMRPASALEFMAGIRDQLIGTHPDLKPNFPTTKSTGVKERRILQRFGLIIDNARVSLAPGATAFDATVVNISTGGICLRMSRAFSVGTNLSIGLPTEEPRLPPKARVCWIHQASDHAWLLGCMFSPEMKNDELQTLMTSFLSKTEANREPTNECNSSASTILE